MSDFDLQGLAQVSISTDRPAYKRIINDAIAEITTLRQQLEQERARAAVMMACLDQGLEAWERYLETGGGSPVAHRAFMSQVRAFNAGAQRLRTQADELEKAGGEQ